MSRRVYLPVLDRRMVLRGAAAGILVSLAGCTAAGSDDDPAPTDAGGGGGGGGAGSGSGSGGSGGGGSTMQLGAGLERCGTQLCLPLKDAANAALKTVEGSRVFDIDGKRLIVVRTSSTAFATLSAICTHQGCSVVYSMVDNDLECPCHGARFATDGAVKLGPATKPLTKYATTYDAATDTVTITLA